MWISLWITVDNPVNKCKNAVDNPKKAVDEV